MLGTEEHNKEYFILDRLFRIFRKKNERERGGGEKKRRKKIDNRGKLFEKITIFLWFIQEIWLLL